MFTAAFFWKLLPLSTEGFLYKCNMFTEGRWLPPSLDFHYKASDSYAFGVRGY